MYDEKRNLRWEANIWKKCERHGNCGEKRDNHTNVTTTEGCIYKRPKKKNHRILNIKIANTILKYSISLRTESLAENAVLFSNTDSSPETNVD